MKPLTPVGSPSPLRLLNKGPDYLRRQMDGGGHGRSVSAVERLEADKAKYVKSQQVINAKQEPALVPCATPPPQPRRAASIPGSPAPGLAPRRPSNAASSALSGSFASRDENENYDSRKENRRTSVDVEARNRSNANGALPPVPRTPGVGSLVAPHSAPVLRRSTGKRMLRPDSLLIYRQKKECKSPHGAAAGDNSNTELRRSESDLRLRCSAALSEQELFFAFCGLDVDMVDRLGRTNFLSAASSLGTLSLALRSVDGDDRSEPSEFSQHSGDGLFQEELAEQPPTGVSIIERNARVIKWLYGCRNAAREGPKESTV
uniref:Si:ch211-107n13.1 n=1 Tax=Gasterosteus aculeatus TaxID=69293 RepID=G3PK42_GASAC